MSMVELGRSYDPHRPSQYSHSHRGSPHLQHLDHSSVHSTPSPPYQYAPLPMISQQQQAPPPPTRPTPTSYPSPASYPSPSMSAYQHPSGLQQQQQPGSRGSPYPQPISLPSLNLPPIRLNPPAQLPPPPPPQQQQIDSPLMGSPLPQPPQPLHGYYPQHGLQPSSHPTHPSNITSSPREALRYQLPSANNERIMSGGRHKKEIKRRTKTGCLTCRKRRIKCDEAHPTCKNCAKSKRDCLGYDPIFKAQPGPAAIQPAPSIGGGQNCAQTNSTATSSPTSEVYEYPAIDPALDAPIMGNPPMLPESQGTFRPELKRSLDRASPPSSGSDTTNRVTPIPRSTTPGQGRLQDNPGGNPAKRIKIDDLLSVVSSSQPLTPPSSETALYATPSTTVEEMKTLYRSRYAPALDRFLETGWFMGPGLAKVTSDSHLVELMAEIFERFRVRGGSFVQEEDPSIGRKGKSAGILWAGVKMVYGTSIPAADNRQDEDEGDFRDEGGAETLRRINIVEALVTGQPLEPMPESPRVTSADKITEDSPTTLFWRFLGRVVAARGGDSEINRQIDNAFADCKQFIEGKETRKLLLAIAEARHLGSSPPYDTLADPAIAEDSTHSLGSLRSYIEGVAKGIIESGSSLSRRIAGRAVGQWKEAITDTPFLR
ncbi:unnamed protein product [Tuber melanosporum]|uniref:(Perigord truffle) hypothetical protein n=1 Tax=Tuber melanosporum (strain Mel28) TaxID=656061 RepID=D5GNR3_TUBMM|nr:uncharacterized protein GSTUM_00011438001 [Tuber melanosporum]CAZ86160.1 unnamed protein product [Tuber melanosporum]